jgi:Striatin family
MKVPDYYFMPGMEDNSSQNHNGQLDPSGGGSISNKQNEDGNQRTQYSIPGILHFIQHEWAKFELERSQWEVERAELQVICSFGPRHKANMKFGMTLGHLWVKSNGKALSLCRKAVISRFYRL